MLMSLCSRLFFAAAHVGALVERVAHGGVDVDRRASNGGASVGSNATFQKSGERRVEDQRAQVVLRAA